MPQLTDEQKQRVTEWITAGLKLSEIQERLGAEYNLRMTYMDARLLIDDLKLTPHETFVPEPPKPAAPEAIPPGAAPAEVSSLDPAAAPAPGGSGKVSISVDQITRPGALVSGKAGFSDGQAADWYLDQTGRFGLVPATPGYRPPAADVAELQVMLDRELAKLGY